MSANEWLEVAKMLGLTTSVWFGLVGWKLVPLFRRPASHN